MEFELAYYDSAVHRFNHYNTRTHPGALEMVPENLEMKLEELKI